MESCQECGRVVKMDTAVINKKIKGEWHHVNFVDVCPVCDTEQLVYAIEYAKYVKDTILKTGKHTEE